MSLEWRPLIEAFVTNVTHVRTFSRVDVHVALQHAWIDESFSTKVTHVVFLSGVSVHVNFIRLR